MKKEVFYQVYLNIQYLQKPPYYRAKELIYWTLDEIFAIFYHVYYQNTLSFIFFSSIF